MDQHTNQEVSQMCSIKKLDIIIMLYFEHE